MTGRIYCHRIILKPGKNLIYGKLWSMIGKLKVIYPPPYLNPLSPTDILGRSDFGPPVAGETNKWSLRS